MARGLRLGREVIRGDIFLMNLPRLAKVISGFLFACALYPSLMAQGPAFDAPSTSAFVRPSTEIENPRITSGDSHRFWDKTNIVLFTAVGAASAADFTVTRANLQSGGRELNPLVRMWGTSTPGLAANFAAETASVIGISYVLHKTHHHKLERIFTMLNIGSSAGAVAYDVAIRAN